MVNTCSISRIRNLLCLYSCTYFSPIHCNSFALSAGWSLKCCISYNRLRAKMFHCRILFPFFGWKTILPTRRSALLSLMSLYLHQLLLFLLLHRLAIGQISPYCCYQLRGWSNPFIILKLQTLHQVLIWFFRNSI
jgi:hypothetical protein